MTRKRNVVMYLDDELVRKTRELGFNLSKTFENHLKQLLTQFSNINSVNNCETSVIVGSPGEIRTPVSGSKAHYACPLHSAESNSYQCSSTGLSYFSFLPGCFVTQFVLLRFLVITLTLLFWHITLQFYFRFLNSITSSEVVQTHSKPVSTSFFAHSAVFAVAEWESWSFTFEHEISLYKLSFHVF